MRRTGKQPKCEILHGVLYPKFQKHCFGLVTDEGEDYEIRSLPDRLKTTNYLYEPVKVIGQIKKGSALKVLNLETENEPPEIENASIKTTVFPSLAYA